MTGSPLEQLYSLARSSSSGELICAGSQVEIHVFLQAGRVAWATDSRHPFAFATHLQAEAAIDPDTFRQVVEECRRERLPLGETLVEWGLATWEGVRSSLAHQISLAITQLSSLANAKLVFLERTFATYNDRLTFDVTEFAAPRGAEPQTSSRAFLGIGTGLAKQLRAAIEGLTWVEVLEHAELVEADPVAPAMRVPRALARGTLLDGADFLAIRTASSNLVGVNVKEPTSLWCRLAPDSTFGGVVSAIWLTVGIGDKSYDRPPPRPDAAVWWIGGKDEPVNTAVGAFQLRAPEVLAAVVLDGNADPVAGCGCSAIKPDRCLDLARRRARNLDTSLLTFDDVDRTLDSIGFSLRSMVSGEGKLWCFGAQLARDVTLWLFLDRLTSQGLGWAYLTALARTVSHIGEKP